MNKKLKKIKVVTILSLLALSRTVSANEIETSVNKGGQYLLDGFLAILKWGGILGLIASFVGIVVVQDADALKKLKVALVICILAVAIGFSAKLIVTGVT